MMNTRSRSLLAPAALIASCLPLLAPRAEAQLQIVNNVPGTFINIKNLPGRIALNLAGDDEATITTTVGNAFYPAGTVIVGNNGGIGFNPPLTDLGPIPGPLPSNDAFGKGTSLLPYWADIGNHVGNVYWIELNNNKLIVQWDFKRFECCPTSPTVTFQCQVNAAAGFRDCVYAQFLYDSIETSPADGGANATIASQVTESTPPLIWSLSTPFAVSNGTVLSVICKPPCRPDFNNDGFLTGEDFDSYVEAFLNSDLAADFDGDDFVNGADFDAYVSTNTGWNTRDNIPRSLDAQLTREHISPIPREHPLSRPVTPSEAIAVAFRSKRALRCERPMFVKNSPDASDVPDDPDLGDPVAPDRQPPQLSRPSRPRSRTRPMRSHELSQETLRMKIRPFSVAALLAATASLANASPPLTLRYSTSDLSDGSHRYAFVLTLDDPASTWTQGDGFGWVIFGDRKNTPGAFLDWTADPGSLSTGPWSFFSNTSGYNNGATLGEGRAIWVPTRKGESVTWSGVTHSALTPADLKWSCLLATYVHPLGKPRGPIADFEPAVLQCRADFNQDGFLAGDDFDAYVAAYALGDIRADYDLDGFLTGEDFDAFLVAFELGC